VQGRVLSL